MDASFPRRPAYRADDVPVAERGTEALGSGEGIHGLAGVSGGLLEQFDVKRGPTMCQGPTIRPDPQAAGNGRLAGNQGVGPLCRQAGTDSGARLIMPTRGICRSGGPHHAGPSDAKGIHAVAISFLCSVILDFILDHGGIAIDLTMKEGAGSGEAIPGTVLRTSPGPRFFMF